MSLLSLLLLLLTTSIALLGIVGQFPKRRRKPWYKVPSVNQWSLIILTLILFVFSIIQEKATEKDLRGSKEKIDSLERYIRDTRLSALTKIDSLSVYYSIAFDLKNPIFNHLLVFIDSMQRNPENYLKIKDSILLFNFNLPQFLKGSLYEEGALRYFLSNFNIQVSLVKTTNFSEARRSVPDCGFAFQDTFRFGPLGMSNNLSYNPLKKELVLEGQTLFSFKGKCSEKYLSEIDLPGSIVNIEGPAILREFYQIRKLIFVNKTNEGLKVQINSPGTDSISLTHGLIAPTSTWQKIW